MDKFVDGFKSLGIPASTPLTYQGPSEFERADVFARQFKKCSILQNHNIGYSSNTAPLTEQSEV